MWWGLSNERFIYWVGLVLNMSLKFEYELHNPETATRDELMEQVIERRTELATPSASVERVLPDVEETQKGNGLVLVHGNVRPVGVDRVYCQLNIVTVGEFNEGIVPRDNLY